MKVALSIKVFVFTGFLILGGSHPAYAEGANKMERFHLKRLNCPYTREMGEYLYKCVKANEGFNAHWCHNETVAVFCPVNDQTSAE
tara:strand:+ start:223 stop:480 length:258 start_codon:yes stop_codon:yes gene_type:complete